MGQIIALSNASTWLSVKKGCQLSWRLVTLLNLEYPHVCMCYDCQSRWFCGDELMIPVDESAPGVKLQSRRYSEGKIEKPLQTRLSGGSLQG
jgi:hypothetical protein